MNILERIEEGLENIFEGIFHRGKGKLEPASLARSLYRTMQRASRRGVENIYVPNFFQVKIAESEYLELEPLLHSLALECQNVLSRRAQERGYSSVGSFEVEIISSPDLEPGKWDVAIVAFRDQPGQMLEEENTKRWRKEELGPFYQLRVLHGPDQGKAVSWQGEAIYLGRAVTGLNLNDTNISREHAKIQQLDGVFYLTDLGSTNGTFLNSKKIKQELLNPGDEICIGETIMVWEKVS